MSWRSTLLGIVSSAPLISSASSLETAYVSNQWDDPGVLYYYLCRIIIGLGMPNFKGPCLAMICMTISKVNSGSLIQPESRETEVPLFHSSCPES